MSKYRLTRRWRTSGTLYIRRGENDRAEMGRWQYEPERPRARARRTGTANGTRHVHTDSELNDDEQTGAEMQDFQQWAAEGVQRANNNALECQQHFGCELTREHMQATLQDNSGSHCQESNKEEPPTRQTHYFNDEDQSSKNQRAELPAT